VRVAFRLDDIQDFFLSGSQIAVLNLFKSMNVPLTIGVIGGPPVFGNDPVILQAVRNATQDPHWEVEIACHGNLHEDFSVRNESLQRSLIIGANANIKALLNITQIDTFIPPFNSFNNYTIPVVKSLGFKYFSSQIQIDTTTPYLLSGQSFYRFPIGASTSDLAITTIYYGISAAQSFSQITSQITADGYAAVMMHPMDFVLKQNGNYIATTNTSQLQELKNLITMVQKAGYETVTIHRLNSDSAPWSGPTTAGQTPVGSTSTIGSTTQEKVNPNSQGELITMCWGMTLILLSLLIYM